MKKIMFSEGYGLTGAVLRGDKTMTRRISDYPAPAKYQPKYEVGEEVAIAQSYKNDDVLTYNAYNEDGTAREDGFQRHKEMLGSKGYRNKMFVKADLMPHHIRITDLWFERLQNISDDDCLKEGIHVHNPEPGNPNFIGYAYDATPGTNVKRWWFHTPREAFAALINRVSGPHTWDGNPWVIAYTFELVD